MYLRMAIHTVSSQHGVARTAWWSAGATVVGAWVVRSQMTLLAEKRASRTQHCLVDRPMGGMAISATFAHRRMLP